MPQSPPPRKSLFCLTLGCAKNRVDSERMLGRLAQAGCEIVSEPEGADICLLNTCSFIQPAVEEGIAAILDLVELKKSGDVGCIAVAGCLVNRYGEALCGELPEVDHWLRCEDYAGLARLLADDRGDRQELPQRRIFPSAHRHTRYLKLAEGCDNRCNYCAIPSIRGSLRSIPIDPLVREALQLVEEGARELCLVSQDLTAYGKDFGAAGQLIALLDALESTLPREVWIRLLYLQPMGVDRPLLERVANGGQILPYLDMPIQHASAPMLARMNRPGDPGALRELFETARRIRPDFALRTTCLVGFPGETCGDFDMLRRFVEEVQFDRLGAFTYFREEGTPAFDMADQVPERTKKRRWERLMTLQEDISLVRQGLFLECEMDVLVDAVLEDGSAEGRSFREAPEVDGVIEISSPKRRLFPGDRVRARITDVSEHDMLGELL